MTDDAAKIRMALNAGAGVVDRITSLNPVDTVRQAHEAFTRMERREARLRDRIDLLVEALRDEHPMWKDRGRVLGHDPNTCRVCRIMADLSGDDRRCITLHAPYCVALGGDTPCTALASLDEEKA